MSFQSLDLNITNCLLSHVCLTSSLDVDEMLFGTSETKLQTVFVTLCHNTEKILFNYCA